MKLLSKLTQNFDSLSSLHPALTLTPNTSKHISDALLVGCPLMLFLLFGHVSISWNCDWIQWLTVIAFMSFDQNKLSSNWNSNSISSLQILTAYIWRSTMSTSLYLSAQLRMSRNTFHMKHPSGRLWYATSFKDAWINSCLSMATGFFAMILARLAWSSSSIKPMAFATCVCRFLKWRRKLAHSNFFWA